MKKKLLLILYFFVALFFLSPFLSFFVKGTNIKLWQEILFQRNIYESLWTTFIIIFLTIIFNFLIGTPLAIFMGKENFKGKFLLEILIYLPLVIPILVSTMGVQFAFIKMGLIDSILGVSIVHTTVTMPYYIKSVRDGYISLNKDYFKLGRILGGNSIEIFFKITFPMLRKSFMVGVTLITVVSLAQYLGTFIIGGGTVETFSILMFPYLVSGNMEIGIVYSIIYILFSYFLIILIRVLINLVYRESERDD